MIKVASVGVVSAGCSKCKGLKAAMLEAFRPHGITLSFMEVGYENDTDYAAKICEEYGFDDIPSFEVGGIVFQDGFGQGLVDKAARAING
jgi:hypothetical protein